MPQEVQITADAKVLRVGRHPGCDIVLPIYHVSKTHAELHLQGGPGQWTLMMRDVSSNGMWLNRAAVEPGRLIEVFPGALLSKLL